MDPLRLQQYRQALGISQWVPRSRLPAAPESRLCELPQGVRLVKPQEQGLDASRQAMPSNQNPQVREQTLDKDKPQSIRARLKLELGSEPSGKQLPRQTEEATVAGKTVVSGSSFSLVFWQIASGELLVVELPPDTKELKIPVRNYIQDMLFSLGYQSPNGQPGSPFHWPMVNSAEIDQSDHAASQALIESLQTYHNVSPIKRIIVLGQVPGRLLAAMEHDFNTLRGKSLKVHELQCELLVTHGIDAVFTVPVLKAQVWMDLAPFIVAT